MLHKTSLTIRSSHLFFNILGLVACGNSSNAWQINESQIRYIGGTDFQVNHLVADAFPLTSESILSCKTRNSSRNDPNSEFNVQLEQH